MPPFVEFSGISEKSNRQAGKNRNVQFKEIEKLFSLTATWGRINFFPDYLL